MLRKLVLFLLMLVACDRQPITEDIPSEIEIIHFKVSVTYNGERYSDLGVLMLPYGYNLNSENTDLIVYCHSGGGTVAEHSSECESMPYCKYLVTRGYAILSMAAMPAKLSRRLKIDHDRTVGSEISLECSLKGLDYVRNNYVFSGQTYLLSNSNGGLLASNLVHFSEVEFNAQCGIAPLLSIENNAWNISSGAMSGGRFSRFQNRANIIALFGMPSVSSVEELIAAKYDKAKVGELDPYHYYMNETDAEYPCPYLVFSCVNDNTVLHSITSEFCEEMNRRGGHIQVDTTTSYGAHNVSPNPRIIGSFSYKGELLELNEIYEKIHVFYLLYRH